MPDEEEEAAAAAAAQEAQQAAAAAKAAEEAKLGEAGVRALEAEREARKKAEREAKATKVELDKIRTASQTDQEKALAAAREEGKTEATKAGNAAIVKAEVRALAAGRMDPKLAVRLLDLDEFSVDDDGEVDDKAITKAIDQLLKETPGLAAAANNGGRGSADQGARGAAVKPADMNEWLRGGQLPSNA